MAIEPHEMAHCPREPMLVYDGDCGFCTRCAEWARERVPNGHEVCAWQDRPDLRMTGLTAADVTSASYWIDANGRAHRGEQGIALALIAMGGVRSVASRALLMPYLRSIVAALYRFIARNPHRMPGGTSSRRIDDTHEAT